jgi:leucyl-tRNA synthetase
MASRRTDLERQADTKEKTGVFTGGWAVNPVNGTKVPVFVADYVLMGYGTGAIMAVPAQDERDWDFATRFDLPIVRTVEPPADHDPDTAFTGDGPAINSQNATLDLDGLGVADAKAAMITWLEEHHWGEGTISYKLRDWLFSRQRYWGEPFPIVFDAQGVAHALPESMLPLELPDVPDYSPKTFDPEDNSFRAGGAAGAGHRVGQCRARPRRRTRPAPLHARDEHDAQLGRLVLVLPALPRPRQP